MVYVDGGTVTEANPVVLRDRQKLGAPTASSPRASWVSKRGRSVAAVEGLWRRGVSSSAEELLLGEAQDVVRAQLAQAPWRQGRARPSTRCAAGVRNALSNLLWNKTHTRPMVIPAVLEV